MKSIEVRSCYKSKLKSMFGDSEQLAPMDRIN